MAEKKPNRIIKAVKEFLTPLQVKQDNPLFRMGPTLEPYSTERERMARNETYVPSRRKLDEPIPPDDEVDKINRDRMEQAKLSQAYEAMAQSAESLNLTLKSQHRLLVATIITALVALIVSLISLVDKPSIVNVTPPEVKVNVTP